MQATQYPAAHRVVLLLVAGLLACSSKSSLHIGATDGSASDGGGGAGDSAISTGGEVSRDGTRGEVDGAASAIDAGGVLDGPCDLSEVWGLMWARFNTIQGSLVQTWCSSDTGTFLGGQRGQLVFDGSGQIVDDTNYAAGLGGPSKSEWLASAADYRWPCAAGTTVPYACESGGD